MIQIKLPDGQAMGFTPSKEAEEELDRLAKEHPDATIDELIEMLLIIKHDETAH